VADATRIQTRTVDDVTFTVKRRCSFPHRPGRLGVRALLGKVGRYVECDADDYDRAEAEMIEAASTALLSERGSRHWLLMGEAGT
jgi:hypothetical protein